MIMVHNGLNYMFVVLQFQFKNNMDYCSRVAVFPQCLCTFQDISSSSLPHLVLVVSLLSSSTPAQHFYKYKSADIPSLPERWTLLPYSSHYIITFTFPVSLIVKRELQKHKWCSVLESWQITFQRVMVTEWLIECRGFVSRCVSSSSWYSKWHLHFCCRQCCGCLLSAPCVQKPLANRDTPLNGSQ